MSVTTQTDKMRVRHIRMPDPLFEEFADNAADDGLSVSELIRYLMRKHNEEKRASRARAGA